MWFCPGVFCHRRMCIGSYLLEKLYYLPTHAQIGDQWSSFFGRPDPVPTFPCHHQSSSIVPRSVVAVPISNPRCEGYVRLPFVDDLRLRGAMQGFLTGESSHEAKLTRRQTRSSKCQRRQSEKILPSNCYLNLQPRTLVFHFHSFDFRPFSSQAPQVSLTGQGLSLRYRRPMGHEHIFLAISCATCFQDIMRSSLPPANGRKHLGTRPN